MPLPANLPTDFLRSFVAGVDLGGLSAAATLLGRTASTLSLQIDRLEEIAGTALFIRKGRGLALTEAGAALLPYARRMLALNDEALTRLADLRCSRGSRCSCDRPRTKTSSSASSARRAPTGTSRRTR